MYRLLTESDLLRTKPTPPEHRFESSGDPDRFAALLTHFMGGGMPTARRVVLETSKGQPWR